jgi:hypothetical protein
MLRLRVLPARFRRKLFTRLEPRDDAAAGAALRENARPHGLVATSAG